jgi:hypothetical protein
LRNDEGEIFAQCRAECIHESKLWDINNALNQEMEFSAVLRDKTDGVSFSEVFDVFSIPLMGATGKEIECELKESALQFTVYDLGQLPTKLLYPAEEVSGKVEGQFQLRYQSLVDIFSRGLGVYRIKGYRSALSIETDQTKDVIARYM